MIPADIREQLAMQREAALHAAPMQDGLGRWWAGLSVNDRRLLLAFCGLDDSEAAAQRTWQQMLIAHRDELFSQCKALQRVVGSLKWF